MTRAAYKAALGWITAAETIDELRAVAGGFTVDQFTKAEDAELTKAYDERQAELRRRAREGTS